MSPNLATTIQRAKRLGNYRSQANRRNRLVMRSHPTASNHTAEFLVKATKPDYKRIVYTTNLNSGSIV